MKPDGIHFAPGTIKGLPFRIFLDLSEPKQEINFDKMNGIAERLLLAAGEPKPKIPAYPGRINYKIHNFCARCKIKYGKDVYRCKNCKSRVRTKPWASNYNRKKKQNG